jgi:hypothetical protein
VLFLNQLFYFFCLPRQPKGVNKIKKLQGIISKKKKLQGSNAKLAYFAGGKNLLTQENISHEYSLHLPSKATWEEISSISLSLLQEL